MAYLEFYCDPINGSNLNAGTSSGQPLLFGVNGSWNNTTSTYFTPSINPVGIISSGDWISIYPESSGAGGLTPFVGMVDFLNSTGIVINPIKRMGEIATGDNNVSFRFGGAWLGPNPSSNFPRTLFNSTTLPISASSSYPRINFRNNAKYSPKSIMSFTSGPIVINGYSSTVDDGGIADFDCRGGLTTSQVFAFPANTIISNIRVSGIASQSAVSMTLTTPTLLRRVTVCNTGGPAFAAVANLMVDNCEFYRTCLQSASVNTITGNQTLFLKDSSFHDNPNDVIVTTVSLYMDGCLFYRNGRNVINSVLGTNSIVNIHNCDFYQNAHDAIKFANTSTTSRFILNIKNTNFVMNSGFGINIPKVAAFSSGYGFLVNCGWGGGAFRNGSGTTFLGNCFDEIDSIFYKTHPYVNATGCDFRIRTEAIGEGATQYINMTGIINPTSYKNIGALQSNPNSFSKSRFVNV